MFGWQNQWGFVTIDLPTWNLKVWGTPKSKSPKPFCNSPKSVSTLRGSYGKCKGRCLIRVLTLGRGILPVNVRLEWPLWNLDMRFDCAGHMWRLMTGSLHCEFHLAAFSTNNRIARCVPSKTIDFQIILRQISIRFFNWLWILLRVKTIVHKGTFLGWRAEAEVQKSWMFNT